MSAGEFFVLLLVLALLAIQVAIPLLLRRWGRAVAAKHGTSVFRVASWLPIAGLVVVGLGICVSIALLIRSFGAVAGADSSTKATQLAKGISEAMNCGTLFGLGAAWVTYAVSALVFIAGSIKRAPER